MISVDMIAYNPAGANANKALVYGGSSSASAPVRANLVAGLTRYGGLAAANPAQSVDWSDHESFRAAGMDSCILIEYNEATDPHYHEATDSTDTAGYVDYLYASKMTRGVAGYLCLAAGIVPPASLRVSGGGSQRTIVWDGAPNVREALECRDDLRAGSWRVLRAGTNTTGASMSYTDNTSGVPQRFYRVRRW
jgi:hypothetical protein